MRRSRRNRLRLALLLVAASGVLPAAAQTTMDGTNCIVFYPTPHNELARCARLLPKGHPLKATTLTVTLMGDPPNLARSVRLSLDGAPPFQDLPLHAAPPISLSDVGMRFADMNFDGLVDFGVLTTAEAGPRGTYQWFIFHPAKKRFEADKALSALPDPRADKARKRIVVKRLGRTPTSDLYRWDGYSLRLDERIERICAGGRCTCRHLKPRHDGFALKRTVPCG